MSTYTVTRWDSKVIGSVVVTVEANNHKNAIRKSGLMAPGAEITADGPVRMSIRYKVTKDGKLIEQASYTA